MPFSPDRVSLAIFDRCVFWGLGDVYHLFGEEIMNGTAEQKAIAKVLIKYRKKGLRTKWNIIMAEIAKKVPEYDFNDFQRLSKTTTANLLSMLGIKGVKMKKKSEGTVVSFEVQMSPDTETNKLMRAFDFFREGEGVAITQVFKVKWKPGEVVDQGRINKTRENIKKALEKADHDCFGVKVLEQAV